MRNIIKKRAANLKWHYAHKEDANARCRRYYETHKAEQKEYMRLRWAGLSEEQRAVERARGRKRRGVLGATGEQKTGICSLCLKNKKLVLDHDHSTGKIRDWICSRCNTFLGIYEGFKSGGRLQAFEEYISQHQGGVE